LFHAKNIAEVKKNKAPNGNKKKGSFRYPFSSTSDPIIKNKT
jgi:hypothetical protein